MSSDQSFWYRLGFALERARGAPAKRRGKGARKLASLKERTRGPTPPTRPVKDDLLSAGTTALAVKALDVWRPRGGVGPVRLVKAGLAGAGAALLVDLVRPVLRGKGDALPLDRSTVDRLLSGAVQGILYAGVVEPRIPGPPLLKGTLYGSTEYVADPQGGLTRLLGTRSALRRTPLVSLLARLLGDLDAHDRVYLEHVTFGILLALLYGSSPRSNGIAPPDRVVE
ncbi:MAG: hypothetical protein LJF06_04850 [Gemmatimonadetes bacterium]|nr:hypothetical protein [Gemmatimonadota bacterium]